MKTIAQIIHNKSFPLFIFDSNGNRLYGEYEDGFWAKRIFNKDGVKIYYGHSDGWAKDKRE